MAGTAIAFTSLYLAAGAVTPLLVVYKEQWRFPAALLTLAFAVYAVGFLSALLTVGSLSDHVGRRPALIGALVIQLASNGLFLVASDIGWVIAGRISKALPRGQQRLLSRRRSSKSPRPTESDWARSSAASA